MTTFRAEELSCKRQQKLLFTNLSFKLNAGELLLIEGENGSGKSSLLRILSGISSSLTGDIFWNGKSIQRCQKDYWSHLHYVSHSHGNKLNLSVAENLQLLSHLTLKTPHDIDAVLSQLQLSEHLNTQVKYLSAGQKRRLALAKLFLFPKMFWLLDEPLTSLDRHFQTFFLLQLQLHLKNNGMVIMSTHHSILFKDIAVKTLSLSTC